MSETKNNLYVNMLGQFTCQIADTVFDVHTLRSLKIEKLFAYLLLNHTSPVSHESLIVQLQIGSGDNPYGTLKNLVYRLRTVLAEVFPNEDIIKTSKGTYSISKDYELIIDVEKFEKTIFNLGRSDLDANSIKNSYLEIINLYQGELLPSFATESWVIPMAVYLRLTYLGTLKKYLYLLQKENAYERLYEISEKGLAVDPLDEELYYLNIYSLIKQEKYAQAMSSYNQKSQMLLEEFGVHPSNKLKELYNEIKKSYNNPYANISDIQSQLSKNVSGKGAFYCDYGVFEEIYQVFYRWGQRHGEAVYLVLLSVHTKIPRKKEKEMIKKGMDDILRVLKESLREGDIITKYSYCQYLIILPACTKESTIMVMQRTLANYTKERKTVGLEVEYELSSL